MTIFLDASAVICATEDSPAGRQLRERLQGFGDEQFAISPLVRLESLVRPLRTGDSALVRRRLSLLDACHSLRIDEQTCEIATHIRTRHNLRTPDALHLATAGQHGCAHILTSDRQILHSAPGFALDLNTRD